MSRVKFVKPLLTECLELLYPSIGITDLLGSLEQGLSLDAQSSVAVKHKSVVSCAVERDFTEHTANARLSQHTT